MNETKMFCTLGKTINSYINNLYTAIQMRIIIKIDIFGFNSSTPAWANLLNS